MDDYLAKPLEVDELTHSKYKSVYAPPGSYEDGEGCPGLAKRNWAS